MVVGLPSPEPAGKGDKSKVEKGAGAPKKAVQLSLRLRKLCAGLGPATLHEGAVVPACVRSAEDHGYTLDLGVKVRAGQTGAGY